MTLGLSVWIRQRCVGTRGALCFVLRWQGKEAKFFQGILDRINTTEYSSRRDFKKKRRRFGGKVYEVRSQELERLWTGSFKAKKFTEQEASYFDLVMTDERPGSYYRRCTCSGSRGGFS